MRERTGEYNKAVREADSTSESHSYQEEHFQPPLNPEPPEESSYEEYGATVEGDAVPPRTCSERSVEDVPPDGRDPDSTDESSGDPIRRYDASSSMGDGGSVATASGATSVTISTTVAANALVTIAAVAVVAVAVVVPLLGAPSAIFLEDCIVTDSSIYYQLYFEDYEEGMELTVDLHNNFTHRTHTVSSERFSMTEYGLKPDMEYTLTVSGSMSMALEEFTIRTLGQYDEPVFTMNSLVFDDADFAIDCSFTVSDLHGEWSDFRVNLVETGDEIRFLGAYDIDDVDSMHSFPLPELNDGMLHEVEVSILCDMYGQEMELYHGVVAVGGEAGIEVFGFEIGPDSIAFDVEVDDPFGAYSNIAVVAVVTDPSSGESYSIEEQIASSGAVVMDRSDSFTFADVVITITCDILGEGVDIFSNGFSSYDAPAIGNVEVYGHSAGTGEDVRIFDVTFDLADPLGEWDGEEFSAGFVYPGESEPVWSDAVFTSADRGITFAMPRTDTPSRIVFASSEEIYNEPIAIVEPSVSMDSLVFDGNDFAIDFRLTVIDPRGEWSGSRVVFRDSTGAVVPSGDIVIESGISQTLPIPSFNDGLSHIITAEVLCTRGDETILILSEEVVVGYDASFSFNNLSYGDSVTFDVIIDDPYGSHSGYSASLTVVNASDPSQSYSLSSSFSGSGHVAIARTDDYFFADMSLSIACLVNGDTAELFDGNGSDYEAPAIGNVEVYGHSAGPGVNQRTYDISFDLADPAGVWDSMDIRVGYMHDGDSSVTWTDVVFTNVDRQASMTIPGSTPPSRIAFALAGDTLEEIFNEPVSIIEPTASLDSIVFDSDDYAIYFTASISNPRGEWDESEVVFMDFTGAVLPSGEVKIIPGEPQNLLVPSLRDGSSHLLNVEIVCHRGAEQIMMHHETLTVGYDASVSVTDLACSAVGVSFDIEVDDPHGAYSGIIAVAEVTDASAGGTGSYHTDIAANGSFTIPIAEPFTFMDIELSIVCEVLGARTVLFLDEVSNHTSPAIGGVEVYGHPVEVDAETRLYDVTFDLVDAEGEWSGMDIRPGLGYDGPNGMDTVWGDTTFTSADREASFTVTRTDSPVNILFSLVGTTQIVIYNAPITITEPVVSVDSLAFDSDGYVIDFKVSISDPRGEWDGSAMVFSNVTGAPSGEVAIVSGTSQSLPVPSFRDGESHVLMAEVVCSKGGVDSVMYRDTLTVGYDAGVTFSNIVYGDDVITFDAVVDDPHSAFSGIVAVASVTNASSGAVREYTEAIGGSGRIEIARDDGFTFSDIELSVRYVALGNTVTDPIDSSSGYDPPAIGNVVVHGDPVAESDDARSYVIDFDLVDPNGEWDGSDIAVGFDYTSGADVESVPLGNVSNIDRSISSTVERTDDPVSIWFELIGIDSATRVYTGSVEVIAPAVALDRLEFDEANFEMDFEVTVSDPEGEFTAVKMVLHDVDVIMNEIVSIASGTTQSVPIPWLNDGRSHVLSADVVCTRNGIERVMISRELTVGYDASVDVGSISFGDGTVSFTATVDDPFNVLSDFNAELVVRNASDGIAYTLNRFFEGSGTVTFVRTDGYTFADVSVTVSYDMAGDPQTTMTEAASDYTLPAIGNVQIAKSYEAAGAAGGYTYTVTYECLDPEGSFETMAVGLLLDPDDPMNPVESARFAKDEGSAVIRNVPSDPVRIIFYNADADILVEIHGVDVTGPVPEVSQ